MPVHSAVVPLYPKLRLSARELIKQAGAIYPMFNFLLGKARDSICIDLKFMLNGKYLEELLRGGQVEHERAIDLSLTRAFPRYLGIIRFFANDEPVCDVLCDTTDIARTPYSAVMGFVCFKIEYAEQIKNTMRDAIPHLFVI